MKRVKRSRKSEKSPQKNQAGGRSIPKAMFTAYAKRASIFRNGSNQAVRLPQELRFADDVKEVRIRKQGDSLLISPVKPDWASFFAIDIKVPDDFLAGRSDAPPQSRAPL
jgi:antitoxin VapB